MVICKVCKKDTPVAVKGEFLCFKCYDQQVKAKPIVRPNGKTVGPVVT